MSRGRDPLPARIGHGFDIHRFAPDRKLVLGGVHIRHDRGLIGHSDADCLCHALADAILGALALPDIGRFFPDSDPANAGMDSLRIVEHAVRKAHELGYVIGNADLTVIAEEPRIAPHLEAIRNTLCAPLAVSPESIGIKATTHEKLGSLGAAEGIAAHAVVLLWKRVADSNAS